MDEIAAGFIAGPAAMAVGFMREEDLAVKGQRGRKRAAPFFHGGERVDARV
jgi:hypothetical protein